MIRVMSNCPTLKILQKEDTRDKAFPCDRNCCIIAFQVKMFKGVQKYSKSIMSFLMRLRQVLLRLSSLTEKKEESDS